MRKVLYIHDGPLLTADNKKYYGVHISDTLRLRYLELGDSVTFAIRIKKVLDIDLVDYSPIKSDKFSVIEIPNFKSIRGYLFTRSRALQTIKKAISEHDIIIARLPSANGTLAVRRALEIKKPLLVEYVACTFDAYWNYSFKGKLIAHYKMWEQKRIMKRVPFTIYVTNKFLQNRYPNNGYSIGCSDVELARVNNSVLITRINKIKLLSGKPTIHLATVAAVDVIYKGQDDVIKAIAKLKGEGYNYVYHLIGKGNQTRLKNISKKLNIEDSVVFHGAKHHSEVFDLLKEFDLYIQPSKQEGLPRALIEAMSVGLPCFGARTAGIPELLDSKMIFSPGQINELIMLLRDINIDILQKQAEINFSNAKDYELENLKQQRNKFYRKFIDANFSSR